jgi:predicted RNA-binding Zn-ribbon protein involved in translation (DUF1610 family)
MRELTSFRERGLDNTLAETFPCSDPLSSIPNPNEANKKELEGAMNIPSQQKTPDRRYLQRECPMCRYMQTIAMSRLNETWICDKCGYVISARRKAA